MGHTFKLFIRIYIKLKVCLYVVLDITYIYHRPWLSIDIKNRVVCSLQNLVANAKSLAQNKVFDFFKY